MLPSEALPPLGSDTEAASADEASHAVREDSPLAAEMVAPETSAPR
jgi:hypothetical protein